ncbi:MAG TPA: YdeI/OmpD-associated family protein [Chryseolinea sp.]|nr:YdeI/OmpD-associated family protein [Chryseolinea sp.]
MKRTTTRKSTLKRDINPMPTGLRELLIKHGLLKLYNARPAYQRNDYLGWISRAKLGATKEKRINQMLTELKQGDRYMRMHWNPK